MEYIDIFREGDFSSEQLKEELQRVSSLLSGMDSPCIEHFVLEAYARLHGRHFDEATAKRAISKMVPSVGTVSVSESLDLLGIDVDTAGEGLARAYSRALSKNGDAPPIKDKVNKWDKLVAVAMAISDYWLFDMEGQLDVAYQFLSDVDAPDTKVWDYMNE